MTYQITPTENDVCVELRAWLVQAIGCEVVRGLDNRVPMPLGGFILMTPGMQKRLATNKITQFADPLNERQEIGQPIEQGVQLDFYGPNSGDWAAIIATLWRDETTCTFFLERTVKLQPLYNSEPMQMALIDGEQQYEERWIVKVQLQYNGVVSLVQQFFTGVNVTLVDVDATIH